MSKDSAATLDPKGKRKNLEQLLNVTSSNCSNDSTNDPTFPVPSNLTFKPTGTSDILSKVQAFLPQIKKANDELERKDLSKLDIENVDEDGQYIEMNLGLGVYDVKGSDQSDSAEDSDEEKEDLEDKKLKIPNSDNGHISKKPLIEEM